MSYRKFRSAYYGRNDSYSRSYNAECAESDGRFPRTRAARFLGISTAAFDAGCFNCGYRSTEWHHVGKYATKVEYYNTNELKNDPDFWIGVSRFYKSRTKKKTFFQLALALIYIYSIENQMALMLKEALQHQ